MDNDLLRQVEEDAVNKLLIYIETFKKFEPAIRAQLRKKYSPEELLEAEGKRCVIAVTGLRYHDLVLYFQVNGLSIKQVEPYEDGDTFIQCPIRIINMFMARMLSGDEDCFGDLVAGNEVRFRGKHTYHDLQIFGSTCSMLAKNIRRLSAIV